MIISVMVPTYRRPVDLRRCLHAIANQTRQPDRVVVVVRENDLDSREVLSERILPGELSIVNVTEPGVVAALNAGLSVMTGDIVAITDDDAAPRVDWLSGIEKHFRDEQGIGGIGGRDHVHGLGPQPGIERVGLIEWFGRQIGNHHLGIGAPRYVHMLKGVNMSFRLSAIGSVRFDHRLRGAGAQVHNELAFCIAVRRKGWRLLYDPNIAVDHYPAQRFDEDQRSRASQLAVSNSAFNETLILLENLPIWRRPIFLAWAFLMGARDLPGLLQAVRLAVRQDHGWYRMPAVLHGRLAAIRSFIWSRFKAV